MADRPESKKIDLSKLYSYMDDRLMDGYLATIRAHGVKQDTTKPSDTGPDVETLHFPRDPRETDEI